MHDAENAVFTLAASLVVSRGERAQNTQCHGDHGKQMSVAAGKTHVFALRCHLVGIPSFQIARPPSVCGTKSGVGTVLLK